MSSPAPVTSRIELQVDMMAEIIATRSSDPANGGSTEKAITELAWSGDARLG